MKPREFVALSRIKPIMTASALLVLMALAGAWYHRQYHQRHVERRLHSILDIGLPARPYTVLIMGCDLPYTFIKPRTERPDVQALTGRSDTMIVLHVDPESQTISGIHIPRDTNVYIPGYGYQKINAANALGGPVLAEQTVAKLLQIPIDHYVVLNVNGLMKAVNELGGVTIDIPNRMVYTDWTAKLKIDLEPGTHTLTGNQAMGFVRFRHDELGDIGRVQRQQMFIRAFMNKVLAPHSWNHIPALLQIAHDNVSTDLSDLDILQSANLARSIPHSGIRFALLPGRFGSQGAWVPDGPAAAKLVARVFGTNGLPEQPTDIVVSVQNLSGVQDIQTQICKKLRRDGYTVVVMPSPDNPFTTLANDHRTRIIAQQASYTAAENIRATLGNKGEIVNASVGYLYSNITLLLNDDLKPLLRKSEFESP